MYGEKALMILYVGHSALVHDVDGLLIVGLQAKGFQLSLCYEA